MTSATFQVWRGSRGEGQFSKYTTEISDGMVVLDAVHKIQAEQANDLGVRWGDIPLMFGLVPGPEPVVAPTEVETLEPAPLA